MYTRPDICLSKKKGPNKARFVHTDLSPSSKCCGGVVHLRNQQMLGLQLLPSCLHWSVVPVDGAESDY